MPANCYLHKHRESTGQCAACRRPICTRCTSFDELRPVCPACTHEVQARTRWRHAGRLALGVVLAVGALSAAWMVFTRTQVGARGTGGLETALAGDVTTPRDPGPSRDTKARMSAAAQVAEAKARVAAAEAAAARSRAEVAEARARETSANAAAARAAAVAEREGAQAASLAAERALAVAEREEAAARQAEARTRLGEVVEADSACVMPTRREGNTMFVEVDFDGSVARMILDTGATHTVVTQDFADSARLAVGEERHMAGTANGQTEFGVAQIGALAIGGRTLTGQTVGVCGNCALGAADGLLGVDVLKALHVQVDLPSGTARFGDCE